MKLTELEIEEGFVVDKVATEGGNRGEMQHLQ